MADLEPRDDLAVLGQNTNVVNLVGPVDANSVEEFDPEMLSPCAGAFLFFAGMATIGNVERRNRGRFHGNRVIIAFDG